MFNKIIENTYCCSFSPVPKEDPKKQLNVFTNDGSFLDQFKQMKDKRLDSKLRSFKSKDMHR